MVGSKDDRPAKKNTNNPREQYQPPKLKEFGQIGPLTQSGSMGMLEGAGTPMGMPTMP